MLDTLPTEIIDRIGDFLTKDDLKLLRLTCHVLTAKSTAAFARTHFHTVTLLVDGYICPLRLARLEQIADHNPGRYAVRSLALYNEPYVAFISPVLPNYKPDGPEKHIVSEQIRRLHACLQKLPNCRALFLTHGSYVLAARPEETLPPPLEPDVLDICAAILSRPGPNFTSVTYGGIGDKLVAPPGPDADFLTCPVFRVSWGALEKLCLTFDLDDDDWLEIEDGRGTPMLVHLLSLAPDLRTLDIIVSDTLANNPVDALMNRLTRQLNPFPPLASLSLRGEADISAPSLLAFLRCFSGTLSSLLLAKTDLSLATYADFFAALGDGSFPRLGAVTFHALSGVAAPLDNPPDRRYMSVNFCQLRVESRVPGHAPFQLVTELFGKGTDWAQWLVHGVRFEGSPEGARLALQSISRAAYNVEISGPGNKILPRLAAHLNTERSDFEADE